MTTKKELALRVADLERELKDALETRSRAIDESIDLRTRLEAAKRHNHNLVDMVNERGTEIDRLKAELSEINDKLDFATANRDQWQRAYERTWEVKENWYDKAKEYEQEIERLKSVISGRDKLLHDQAVNHTAINEKQQTRIAQLIEERNALKQATPTAVQYTNIKADYDRIKRVVEDALRACNIIRTVIQPSEAVYGAMLLMEEPMRQAVDDRIPF